MAVERVDRPRGPLACVNPLLADVPPFTPGPTTAAVAVRTGFSPDRLAKLSSNEAPLGPSPAVREALRRIADSHELHRYPDAGSNELRMALGERLGVTADQVLVADGSSETWPALVRAFSRPGDEVLRVEPSQRGYSAVAWLAERTPRVVPVAHPFEVTAAAVLEAVGTRTRVLFLSTPNNTTSRLIPHEVIREITTSAPQVLVVADEHYIEAAEDYVSRGALALLGELPNLVVTRTFSKMYGLASLRVGYAVAAAELIAEAYKLRSVWALTLPSEVAALAALRDQEHLASNIEATAAGRRQLAQGLATMPTVTSVPQPEGGFLLFAVAGRSGPEVAAALLDHGIMVRGDLLADHVRVSVGTAEENGRFLDALAVVTSAPPLAT